MKYTDPKVEHSVKPNLLAAEFEEVNSMDYNDESGDDDI
jgi:hypothetical protein